jgi:hypothetical protein
MCAFRWFAYGAVFLCDAHTVSTERTCAAVYFGRCAALQCTARQYCCTAMQRSAAQHSTAQHSASVSTRRGRSSFVRQSNPCFSLTALVRVRSAATDKIGSDRIRSDQIGSDRILRHSSAHSVRRLQPLTTTLDLAALMWHTSQATSFVLANQVRLLPPRWVPAVPSHRVPRCTTCSSSGWTTVANRPTGTAWYSRVPAWWYLARGTRVVLAPFARETVAHHACICASNTNASVPAPHPTLSARTGVSVSRV